MSWGPSGGVAFAWVAGTLGCAAAELEGIPVLAEVDVFGFAGELDPVGAGVGRDCVFGGMILGPVCA